MNSRNMEKNKNHTCVVLASASPRRKELLEQIGIKFQVLVSDVEEKITTNIPWELVQELSAQKAEAVMESLTAGSGKASGGEAFPVETPADTDGGAVLVIGADTVVYGNGKILGKPKDGKEAVEMLRALQGKNHEVYTGVTLLYQRADTAAGGSDSVVKKSFYEETKVELFPMTEEEILSYVQTGDPLDKAGAYGIQGIFAKYVKGISGDYNNVVGLPAARVYQEAKEWL